MFVARSLVHIKINPSSKITGVSARGFSQDKKTSKWGMGKQSGTSTPQGGAPQQPPKTTASSVDSPGKAQGRAGSIEVPKQVSKTEESKYALALLSSANKNNVLDEVARDAKLIVSSTQGGALATVGRIFTDRALTTKDRLRKAAPVLKNFNPLTQRVVRVLINDMNGVLVPTVMENYLSLLKEARKEFTAVVSTPKAITAEERQKYIQIAKEKMNRGPDTIINLVERIDDRLESGFTISLPNLYVNKGRVRDEGKKEKKKAAILTGLSTTAIKDMEGPKIAYEQWLTKMRENLTEDLVKQLNVD